MCVWWQTHLCCKPVSFNRQRTSVNSRAEPGLSEALWSCHLHCSSHCSGVVRSRSSCLLCRGHTHTHTHTTLFCSALCNAQTDMVVKSVTQTCQLNKAAQTPACFQILPWFIQISVDCCDHMTQFPRMHQLQEPRDTSSDLIRSC